MFESTVGTPEFEQVFLLEETTGVMVATGVSGLHDPTEGNDFDTRPRSMHAESGKNVILTWWDT